MRVTDAIEERVGQMRHLGVVVVVRPIWGSKGVDWEDGC